MWHESCDLLVVMIVIVSMARKVNFVTCAGC